MIRTEMMKEIPAGTETKKDKHLAEVAKAGSSH
jgi:hypothetical protein